MIDRFRDTKEEKAGADTTAEQHGKPGGVVVFRYTVILNNIGIKSAIKIFEKLKFKH